MKVFLAGNAPWVEKGLYDDLFEKYSPYMLSSYYFRDGVVERREFFGDFILDSGAFSAMQGKSQKGKSWEEYAESYAVFVKERGIEKYIELDLDDVIGLEKTKALTRRIEAIVGSPCIPVWHEARGRRGFEEMCEQYSYVAFGGIASSFKQDVRVKYERAFPWFIRTAHRYGSKIHGLGYTPLGGLRKFHFDSVDSSSWLCGRWGDVCIYKHGDIEVIRRPERKRVSSMRDIMRHNFEQWCLYQKYADEKL